MSVKRWMTDNQIAQLAGTHMLVAITASSERCVCGVTGKYLEHVAEVITAALPPTLTPVPQPLSFRALQRRKTVSVARLRVAS